MNKRDCWIIWVPFENFLERFYCFYCWVFFSRFLKIWFKLTCVVRFINIRSLLFHFLSEALRDSWNENNLHDIRVERFFCIFSECWMPRVYLMWVFELKSIATLLRLFLNDLCKFEFCSHPKATPSQSKDFIKATRKRKFLQCSFKKENQRQLRGCEIESREKQSSQFIEFIFCSSPINDYSSMLLSIKENDEMKWWAFVSLICVFGLCSFQSVSMTCKLKIEEAEKTKTLTNPQNHSELWQITSHMLQLWLKLVGIRKKLEREIHRSRGEKAKDMTLKTREKKQSVCVNEKQRKWSTDAMFYLLLSFIEWKENFIWIKEKNEIERKQMTNKERKKKNRGELMKRIEW